MKIDKWYNEQKLWLKIVLIVVPFVGWVMEILIHLSIYLRTKKTIDLVLFIVSIIFCFPLVVLDVVFLAIKGHIFGVDDFQEMTDGKEHVDGEPKEEKPEEEKK